MERYGQQAAVIQLFYCLKVEISQPFFLGYGMTEIGVTHYNTKDEFRHNSVGKLLELIEMKVKLKVR